MSNILQAAFDMQNEPVHPREDNILKVMEILKSHIFDFVVAGGYARDKHYGKPPKDCDICIYNFHQGDSAEIELLTRMIHKLGSLTRVNFCPAYEEGDSRLGHVIQLPDWKIDIIFYNHAETWGQVLSQFDCNLSQFYLPGSIPTYVTNELEQETELALDEPLHYEGSAPTEFQYLSGDLTDHRIIKMGLKWCEYTSDGLIGEALSTYTAAVERNAAHATFDIPWW